MVIYLIFIAYLLRIFNDYILEMEVSDVIDELMVKFTGTYITHNAEEVPSNI